MPSPVVPERSERRLLDQLRRAQVLGFLGPGAVERHLEHAQGFLDALAGVSGRVIDLGSGGGIPGLVIGVARPDLELILVDAMGKRCRFLEGAAVALGLRLQVVEGRAEVLGHGPLRGTARAVVARSFGPPAATAECAAPLLIAGGCVLVSEPPDGADRWPIEGLAQLGLVMGPRTAGISTIQALRQVRPCPASYPRRNGVPAKRPLF